ncbi:MAG: heavy-metal-associated domain-containing protein [Pirellula sp.]|jgi:copper chaperone CopZ
MKLRTLSALALGGVGMLSGLIGCDDPKSQLPAERLARNPVVSNESEETKTVSFKVDGMTCPSGCYPTVKSAIAKQKGVVDVELAPQKEKDVIDNPIVFVKYKGKLDLESTFKAISRAGFEAEAVSN